MYTLLFPGQGSQQPKMGKFLYDNFKMAKEIFEEASDAINLNMSKLCFDSTDSELALTENTQPALLLVSTTTQIILRKEFGVKASATAGHSIGEYASMVAANVMSFPDAMRAVRLRGQSMQSAVPVGTGGMVAVLGLEPELVHALCQWVVEKSGFSPLSPANDNSPGQIVISGSMKAIEWLKTHFKPDIFSEILPETLTAQRPLKAKLIPLSVSAPFHCEMMKPAEKIMETFLNKLEFKNAEFPIIQNVNAQVETSGQKLRENLIRQISAPVLWTQSVRELKKQGFTRCIECGNGKVLSGLIKKIDAEAFQVFNTNNLDDFKLISASLEDSALHY